MRTHISLILAALFGAAVSAAPADASVRYVFTAFGSIGVDPAGTLTGTFTYVSPSFITPTKFVAAADLASCSATFSVAGAATCLFAEFQESGNHDIVDFSVAAPGVVAASLNYFFAPTAFSTVGVHDTVITENPGELVVSVPELPTWIMTLLGFAGLAAGAHRWRRKAAFLSAAETEGAMAI